MTGHTVVARTMEVDYRVEVDADGFVTTYAFELSPPARRVADSVTFAPWPAGKAPGVVSRGRVPLWNATPGLYDVLLRSANARVAHAHRDATARHADTVAVPLFRFGASSLRDTAVVIFVGRDSARVVLRTDGAPPVELRARVDDQGRLVRAEAAAEGWTVERASALPASAYAFVPPYGAPQGAPYIAEDVRLDVGGGVTLAGTFTRPLHASVAGSERVPAVVFLHGSTASDRNNGRLPLPGVFWQLADTLARRGSAVLRYDQRGIGGSGGASDSATVQVRAADARAALAYLRRRPDVAPGQLGVLGLSEGALAAMLVAAPHDVAAVGTSSGGATQQSSSGVALDAPLRAVVLVSSPGRPGRELSAYQNQVHAQRFVGLRDSALTATLAAARAEDDSVLRVGRGHEAALLAFDPEAAARRVRVPILVVHGAIDLQVPVEDASRLAAALRAGGNADVTVRVFAGVDHVLLADASGDWRRYIAVPSLIAPAVVRGTIADWLVQQLSRPMR
jgi:pimeloyl-ACP methyl ester carboxylesterase